MLNSHPRALGIAAIFALAMAPFALVQAKTAHLQASSPVHFSGTINDYTGATFAGKLVGPWEVRGTWSMDLQGASNRANFSAALNMEKSDWGISEGIVNVEDPSTRMPHTHTLTMTNATVSSDTSSCIANNPANTFLFAVTGPVTVTGNGNPALSGSQLTVCVSGGTGADSAPYSNIELMFTDPAAGHFGSQPIHGVIGATN